MKSSSSDRILVAMSGGVDSSVAAALLKQQGYQVVGAYMKNWINEDNILGDCPWQQDIEDARAVAEALDIEFRVVNLMNEYRERVVKYLLEGYQAGITPNPDVMCNREIKFGVFLDYAREHGFSRVATGHYARTKQFKGTTQLHEGLDANKDQSYFLALMRQEQVASALFPLGELEKPEVRKLAQKFKLPNAEKKDSQGICFIGQVRMSDFLSAYVADSPGNIVDLHGNILGQHRGLHFYTLGQRRGIGVATTEYKRAFVVVEKRAAENELVVALESADTPKLFARRCILSNLSFVENAPESSSQLLARARYRTSKAPAKIFLQDQGRAVIEFESPQRALTPGQVCALHDISDNGSRVIGGGIFETIEALVGN